MNNHNDPLHRDLEKVIIGKTSTIKMARKNGMFFNIEATFSTWTDFFSEKVVVQISSKVDHKLYYHISLCNFCSSSRKFEIHVEQVDKTNELLNYTYINAKKEHFNLPPEDLDQTVQIEILIYNTDPNEPETKYTKCRNPFGSLKFPKISVESIMEYQPKTKKGNILLGGN